MCEDKSGGKNKDGTISVPSPNNLRLPLLTPISLLSSLQIAVQVKMGKGGEEEFLFLRKKKKNIDKIECIFCPPPQVMMEKVDIKM